MTARQFMTNLATLLAVFFVWVGYVEVQQSCAGPGLPVVRITVADAAREIQREAGKARLVMIYGSDCSICTSVFPRFIELARAADRSKLSVLAFATDPQSRSLRSFLGNDELPFERYLLVPWNPGELMAAMQPTGIEIGHIFLQPLIALIGPDGRVVGQAEGVLAIDQVKGWLRSLNL